MSLLKVYVFVRGNRLNNTMGSFIKQTLFRYTQFAAFIRRYCVLVLAVTPHMCFNKLFLTIKIIFSLEKWEGWERGCKKKRYEQ